MVAVKLIDLLRLIGRAVTLQLMPTRAEVASIDSDEWRKRRNTTTLNHQSALDVLQAGDVIVIDAGGSLEAGGIVGDNLAHYIWKKTGTGFVIDASIRDLERPRPNRQSDREVVSFVPPKAVQRLLDEAKITHIHDEWTRMKFADGKYKSTDIYGRPTAGRRPRRAPPEDLLCPDWLCLSLFLPGAPACRSRRSRRR
jgi:4-hydroxy-4-methyl-2-oxoglutarate aldolase